MDSVLLLICGFVIGICESATGRTKRGGEMSGGQNRFVKKPESVYKKGAAR
jgi:hypothetical protein